MPKTIYLDDAFLNAALRGIPFTPPLAVYVALYMIAPNVFGGGTEVTGSGYLRQLVAFAMPENGRVVSAADVLFPVAADVWGTVTSFAILDAVSGGNMLYLGDFSSPRFVDAWDQVRFPAGTLICLET